MSKSLKVIYSTLAVVIIVNLFIFALPILGHAQATEKQAIQQAEFTEAQKAEMNRAQREARLAMYKALNLSTTEQKFVEKYPDEMETFNQILDYGTSNDRSRYVAYIQSNGNATLNVANIYKDIKTLQKATGLSRSQVLTLKDIASKMVKNYNKDVNAIKNKTVKPSKSDINSKSLNTNQEIVETKITKTVNERGVEILAEIILDPKNISTMSDFYSKSAISCSGYGVVYARQMSYWWGSQYALGIGGCSIESINTAGGSITTITTAILGACWTGIVSGPVCTIGWAGINTGVNLVRLPLVLMNNSCQKKGVKLSFNVTRISGMSFPWLACI